MMRIKRVMAMLFACVVVLGLCGCSTFGAPATTEELLVRYVANENVNNFSAKVNVGMSVRALGVRTAIPITTNLRTANNVAHGTIEVDLSALDTRNYTMEFYAELLDDAINCYVGTPTDAGTTWKLWTIDMTSSIDIFTVTDLLSSSELTLLAKDSDSQVSYELTVPTEKVLQTAFDILVNPAEVGGMDERGMLDAVSEDKVRVGFTKDCLMRSLESSVMLTFKSEETNNVEVRSGVEVSATLDDYGKVDPSEVAIPNEVRDAAVPTDEPVDIIEVIGADSPLAGAVGSKAK
ncbi:MAG: hypothetical protein IKG22_01065 [Atopobiaceae bacterium]|nr:hypothetical protein [Atopobiaceae bacterium]